MRVLVYKRTHQGDPNQNGCFGIYDCMGSVRARDFDAIIGIGGIGPEAKKNEIAGKVTWIGIGPHKRKVIGKRGPEVVFDHFMYLGEQGPDFREWAPILSQRIYTRNIRVILDDLSADESEEAIEIVRLAQRAPPSAALARWGRGAGQSKLRCRKKRRRAC